ncbi:thioesterase II family protein [Kutzneria sp. NPDC052558]|uniref:thioesterase II family protein n=1 Tax=Kutzneria sp. NPDC052558 TaxID=3364121 RepID=UPI0037CBE05F
MTASVTNDQWARRYQPAPDAAVRLVCFPHAGGAAPAYLPFAQALSPRLDVVAMQYPGRQDRRSEPFLTTIEAMADAAVEPVLALADRPVALFGHSMGATVAYEVARRLEERGVELRALFASGRRAPSRHRDESVHTKGDNALIAEMKALSGTDSKVLADDEILRMILPVVRNDYRAAETYRWQPGAPLTTPIHVHFGQSDPKVDAEEAQAWQEHTTAEFSITPYPGAHFYLNNQLPRLSKAITDSLGV